MRDRLANPTPQTGDIHNDPGSFWHGAEYVDAYSRDQAIQDGVLVDVTPYVRAAGVRISVAMTAGAYSVALIQPRADKCPSAIDHSRVGAWIVENVRKGAANEEQFTAGFVRIDLTTVTLKSVIGPGDQGEPVITVMLPDED